MAKDGRRAAGTPRCGGRDSSRGQKMKHIPEKKKKGRALPRNSTDAAITCRPFTSSGAIPMSDGVMRNFSRGGSYVETSRKFKSGTILIVRMLFYPPPAPSVDEDVRPRTICLAEVKWRQKLTDENAIRYGMGLKYID